MLVYCTSYDMLCISLCIYIFYKHKMLVFFFLSFNFLHILTKKRIFEILIRICFFKKVYKYVIYKYFVHKKTTSKTVNI